MFQKVNPRENAIQLEHKVLEYWGDNQIFGKLVAQNSGGSEWSFLDGPITANNKMGVHHAWGRTYKDVFQRYQAMQGHHLRYQNGFDCQGLWIEVEVEKELGFTSKSDIEAYGIERFVEKCKDRARKYAAIITDQSIRMGYWMDWENSYYTMSDENNFMIWQFLKKSHEQGSIYKGTDTMPWCPRCDTGMSQHEMQEGYKTVTDTSVFFRVPLDGRENEYLLLWTTTPWTLAANVASAVNPNLKYAKVRHGGESHYVAASLIDVIREKGEFEIEGEISGKDMIGWNYQGPFDELPAQQGFNGLHTVIGWEEISDREGTGIVHIAPGCGREDFELSKSNNLPVLSPINGRGVYLDGFGFLTGKNVGEVCDEILDSLKERGLLFGTEEYEHRYPYCWRCDTPLVYRNVDEWFIDMSWRDRIMEVTKTVEWIPSWGERRELDWLENMQDWMISKKRYWGLALPIYECECGWYDVIGSKEELSERAIKGMDEFEGHSPHRPWIDAVKIECGDCGTEVSRIKDVGDPWLDAGIVPYSTFEYATDRDEWKKWFPADLILECFPGQFRNWFYATLAMSTMLENTRPFKTLFGHALVKDDHGEEMHKSKGNAIWFDEAAEIMGVDVMRWMYCRQNPVNDLNFGYKEGKQIENTVFNTWRNVYAFFCNYALLDEFDIAADRIPVSERTELDRWIISSLNVLVGQTGEHLSRYDTASVIRDTESFLGQLSNLYVRGNRKRFWSGRGENDKDKLSAYQTLYEVLTTLTKLLAPIVPFMTETMYQNLVYTQDPSQPESVHLCRFPQQDETLIDKMLMTDVSHASDLVSRVLSLRESRQIRVRQPLASITVSTQNEERIRAYNQMRGYILDEVNVKDLRINEAGLEFPTSEDVVAYEGQDQTVALDIALTDELVDEGTARDLVRQVQNIRKEHDFELTDRIVLSFSTESELIRRAVSGWGNYICNETLADNLVEGLDGVPDKSTKLNGHEISLRVTKV